MIVAALVLSPGGCVGQTAHHPRARRAARRAGAVLAPLARPDTRLRAGRDVDRAADGSTRRLGPWQQASWSPHGLYVAVASGDQLAAVDPHGTIRWALGAAGRQRSALVLAERLPGGVPVGEHAARRRRRRDRRSPAGHPCGARRPGVATRSGRRPVRARVRHRRAAAWSCATPTAAQILWSTAPGARPQRADVVERRPAPARAVARMRRGSTAANGARPSTLALPRAGGERRGAVPRRPEARARARRQGGRRCRRRLVDVRDAPGARRPRRPRDQLVARRPLAARELAGGEPVGVRSRHRRPARRGGVADRQQFSGGGAARGFPQLEGWCCTARRAGRMSARARAGGADGRGAGRRDAARARTTHAHRQGTTSVVTVAARMIPAATHPVAGHATGRRRSSPTRPRTGCWSSICPADASSGASRCRPIPRTSRPTAERGGVVVVSARPPAR